MVDALPKRPYNTYIDSNKQELEMIDLIVNTIMLVGIAIVSVPVLFFAVVGVAHMAYGAYTLYIEE